MAWAVERLRRHPRLLSRLTEEVDAGGSELRQATIWEVQRTRPVLDAAARRTKTRIRLGDWVYSGEHELDRQHQDGRRLGRELPGPMSFNPDRFLDGNAKPVGWIPFGGGVNRCVGAAFAHMETDITLRTMLREFAFRANRCARRASALARCGDRAGRGARAVVFRRTAEASSGLSRPRWPTTAARNAAGILAAVTSTLQEIRQAHGSYSWFKAAMNKILVSVHYTRLESRKTSPY